MREPSSLSAEWGRGSSCLEVLLASAQQVNTDGLGRMLAARFKHMLLPSGYGGTINASNLLCWTHADVTRY